MSKKASKICAAALCCVLLIASAVTLYKTEESRLRLVSENQSYINCAEQTLALANSLGVANDAYRPGSAASSASEPADDLHRMAAEVKWVAEYDSDASRLAREAAELSTSAGVRTLGSGATYGQMCSAALSYHQTELDSVNSSAAAKTVACIAVFVVSLGVLTYIVVKPEHSA